MPTIYRPDLNPSAFSPVTATNDDGSSVQAMALVIVPSTASGATPPAGTASDPTSQKAVGSSSIATSQATSSVSPAAATQIVAARAGRQAVTITNITGTQPVYFTATASTTGATTGFFLTGTAGATITIPTAAAVFATSPTAAQTLGVLETY